MRRAKRVLIAVPSAVLLGWLGLQAISLAQAGDVSFETGQALNEVIAGRSYLDDHRLAEMHEALEAVVKRAPGDPTLHEQMGILDARRSDSPAYIEEAGRHFTRALELRPVSPYTWAARAAQRYRVGDTGPAFEKALVNATRLGPSEPAVQATVANLGLAVWKDVAPSTRDAIDAMLTRGLRRNPSEFLQISARRGRLDVACHHLSGGPRQADAKWIETCQRMEATS